MKTNVVRFVGEKPANPVIAGVVARSEASRHDNGEDAWVSVVTDSNDHVLVLAFPSRDYGEEAWARAVKYGKRFAERLGVEFRKKRTAH